METIQEMKQSEQLKKAHLEALEKSLGVVTSACRASGVGRTTHYRWLKDDAEFSEQVKELTEVAIDFAETHLHKLIQDGSPAATIFYLKTKGKKRGYVETQDITSGGQPLSKPTWFEASE